MSLVKLATALTALFIAGLTTPAQAQAQAQAQSETVAYTNGRWWNGHTFENEARYVHDGEFTRRPFLRRVREVDLRGAYVLPALSEAHHHRICDESVEQFVRAGILSVGVMNARVSSRACQASSYGPSGVEVLNAMAGITERNAHPSQIGLYFLTEEEIDGEWVHYASTSADLDRIWPRLRASPPDILKIFLSYSEDYERLREDNTIPAWYRGLNPSLASEIVHRAHADGLRVAAHVLSAHDFEVAVAAGVDVIAHMPGFAPGPAFTPDSDNPWLAHLLEEPGRYTISAETASEAADRGIVVMTTLSGVEEAPESASPMMARLIDLQRRTTSANVAALWRAGVTLLIGSDRYDFSAIDEAEYLVRAGLFTPQQAFQSLTYDTPRALFPGRRIGVLSGGHEATFIVLEADPLESIDAIRRPLMVFKRGERLVWQPHAAP